MIVCVLFSLPRGNLKLVLVTAVKSCKDKKISAQLIICFQEISLRNLSVLNYWRYNGVVFKKWSMAQEKSKTLTVVYAQEIPYCTHITTQVFI